MGFEYAKPGIGNVGSYQISGIPFVTGGLNVPGNLSGALVVSFPSVTQNIHIHNHNNSENLRVGFSAIGVSGSNHWLIDAHDASGKNDYSFEMRVRTDKIYLLSNSANAVSGVYVAAELTGIRPEFDLAASYSASVGIG